ncbi:FMN-binding protein [Glaciibacter flavus]|uniref:FMN-binding protein n=1 Tax=Orlajensenia flava TaxID=2565934 RepID=UPI003B009597
MRRRAAIASALSATVVLIVGWELGASARTSIPTATDVSAPTTGDAASGDSAAASAGPAASATATPSPAVTAPNSSTTSGTYTGSDVQTRFGDVQVQVVVANGSITDVVALALTDDENRSRQISARAAPILRTEVLAAQSSQVQMVSGATYTSEAYLTSLQAALDQSGLS